MDIHLKIAYAGPLPFKGTDSPGIHLCIPEVNKKTLLVARDLTDIEKTPEGFMANTPKVALVDVRGQSLEYATLAQVRLFGNGSLGWLTDHLDTLALPAQTDLSYELGKIDKELRYVCAEMKQGHEANTYLGNRIAINSTLPRTQRRSVGTLA